MTWENPTPTPAGPIAVVVRVIISSLIDENQTSALVPDPNPHSGPAEVCVVNASLIPACTDIVGEPETFLRGDANDTGEIDISDAIFTLMRLFASGEPFPCDDAADTNDDGATDISDPVQSLSYIFLGGRPPPPPFPSCGSDPTPDRRGCKLAFPPPKCPEIGCECKKHELQGVRIWNDLTFSEKDKRTLSLKLGFWVVTQLTCTKSEDQEKHCKGTVACTVSSSWKDPATADPISPTSETQPETITIYEKCTGVAGNVNLNCLVYTAVVPKNAAGKAEGTLELTVKVVCGENDPNPTTRVSKLVIKDSKIDEDGSDRDGDGKNGKDEKAAGTSDDSYDP